MLVDYGGSLFSKAAEEISRATHSHRRRRLAMFNSPYSSTGNGHFLSPSEIAALREKNGVPKEPERTKQHKLVLQSEPSRITEIFSEVVCWLLVGIVFIFLHIIFWSILGGTFEWLMRTFGEGL
jgi:hypothetical protein